MFWDGRAFDAEVQAIGPIQDPVEMGMTETSVVKTLTNIPGYVGDFNRAFPSESNPISLKNVGRAIGAFERGLVTRSRWDDYLEGKESALSDGEVDGLRVFLNVGCMGCHTGPQVGASMFKVAGFVEPWPNQSDLGRFELTKNASDRMLFKVPVAQEYCQNRTLFSRRLGEDSPQRRQADGPPPARRRSDRAALIRAFEQALKDLNL
jgi:cytochrome c peroxidase